MNAKIHFQQTESYQKYSDRLEEVRDGRVYGSQATSEQIADVLDANDRIQCYKEEGFHIVVVNATWDLLHPAHMAYLKTIEQKVMKETGWKREDFKLVCGLEHEDRVRKRKSPEKPMFPVSLRRYALENQKQVDDTWVYPDLLDDRCPSDVTMMFAPDILIMHEEHMDTSDKIERLKSKMAHVMTELLLINYKDPKELLGYDIRAVGVSTSKIISRIKQGGPCEDYFTVEQRINENM